MSRFGIKHPALGLLGTLVTLVVLVVLVWLDVLPGGWRLRGWVQPHGEWRQERLAAHRAERLALFARQDPGTPADAVVFLGSSTIERFPLATLFPGAPCVDRGIGSEDVAGLLARLEESLPATRVAGLVLYAASIDFRVQGAPPTQIRSRVATLLDRLHDRLPETPVALVGILPDRDMTPPAVGNLAATNAELARLCGARGVAFVPTDRPPLTTPSGSLAPDLSADHLHLNEAGYRHLARWIREDGGAVGSLLTPH